MIPAFIKRWIQSPVEAFVGKFAHWQQHRVDVQTTPRMREAIANIERRWPIAYVGSDNDPVFIFSAGWRAGSTLLQRLVMSGGDTLMWGEPYPYCDYIRRFAQSITSFRAQTPPDQFFLPPTTAPSKIDVNSWIACLYPNPQHLIHAHRQFFETLYGQPARERGYRRWGLKEVVLSIEDAVYLRWLYPQAKFLFLYRDPYKAYRSYRTFGDWYYRWPDRPVFTARAFGRVWRDLAGGFVRAHQEVGGMLIRYEDLTSGVVTLDDIASYVGAPLQKDVIAERVTGRRAELEPIPYLELRQLRNAVEPLATQLGYRAD